jgi:DNA modification methylase
MASLLKDFKGKIDLIYIDPPFDVGADFTMRLPIGDEEETIEKDQSALEMVAYRDMWGKGTDSYVAVMFERLCLMRELLAESGVFYLHVDRRVSHYLKAILDEVFGGEQFRNEIVWCYTGPSRQTRDFPDKHDVLLRYSKSDGYFFHPVRVPYVKRDTGHTAGIFKKRAILPEEGKIPEDWWSDITPVARLHATELNGFPTQKPEGLLERVITSSCPVGGLVADFFCGSGTTGAVAEKLGRRWIMADLGRFAVHTTRKRLIDVQRTLHAEGKPYRAFDLYNLGRYERQWWQQDALKGADAEHRRVVLEFFRAEVLDPAKSSSPLIHGRKGRALCHVDGIDSIFSAAEAREVAKAAAGMGAAECYCLAWGFEMDIRQRIEKVEAELGVKLTLIPIPREIMEKNRKGPPPWLEVAVLEAEAVYRKDGGVDIKLTKFLPSLAEVPTKELESIKERAVKSGFDFIDFWAIDFEWDVSGEKPFNHHWQDYRTRKDRSLKTVSDAGHTYAKKGKYTACVKVVDVFGCDTSITVQVKV